MPKINGSDKTVWSARLGWVTRAQVAAHGNDPGVLTAMVMVCGARILVHGSFDEAKRLTMSFSCPGRRLNASVLERASRKARKKLLRLVITDVQEA